MLEIPQGKTAVEVDTNTNDHWLQRGDVGYIDGYDGHIVTEAVFIRLRDGIIVVTSPNNLRAISRQEVMDKAEHEEQA